MKTIIITLLLLSASLSSFSQRIHDKEDYIQKISSYLQEATVDSIIESHRYDLVTAKYVMYVEYVDRAHPYIMKTPAYARNLDLAPAVCIITEDPINEEYMMPKILQNAEKRNVKLFGIDAQFRIRELN